MEVKKFKHLDPDQLNCFLEVLVEAFSHNAFVFGHLMDKSLATLRNFFEMMLKFYHDHADFYVLVNESGQWIAAAIFLPPDRHQIGIGTAYQHNMLPSFLKVVLTQPLKCTRRMLQFSSLEEKHWPQEPFICLDALASLEKGSGKTLLSAALKDYAGQLVAVNSSVTHNGHSYYTQFGFEAYQEVVMNGHQTMMMQLRPKHSEE